MILTDGQVSGTEKILADARSAGVRLHCLGIGSASQDRFLALLARETGGVSRFVTPRERVDLSAVDLFASIGRPAASGLKAGANIQPEPPSLVFSGTPVLLFGEAGETEGQYIELRWDGGKMNLPVMFSEKRHRGNGLVAPGLAPNHRLGKPISKRRGLVAARKAEAKPCGDTTSGAQPELRVSQPRDVPGRGGNACWRPSG